MDDILSIVLWGGLIFLMMRFGCGSHMFGHRHGAKQKDGSGNNPGISKSAGCCGGSDDRDAEIFQDDKPNETADLRWTPPPEDKDPVCGKSVSTTGTKSCVYDGWVHYFCSSECRDLFESAPGTYLNNPESNKDKQLS